MSVHTATVLLSSLYFSSRTNIDNNNDFSIRYIFTYLPTSRLSVSVYRVINDIGKHCKYKNVYLPKREKRKKNNSDRAVTLDRNPKTSNFRKIVSTHSQMWTRFLFYFFFIPIELATRNIYSRSRRYVVR